MQFEHFDIDAFLRDHWQKKPLLIRNPWSAWDNPLAPDELAGLACESAVESRLIASTPDRLEVEHGPLAESRFRRLEEAPWTLLVQAVDHHVDAVSALLAPFRFIPNWRVDDVMVSYAVDGGGVGPHFDHYDVFLVQGLGRRRWQLGGLCDSVTEMLPHDDLRLLARFEPTEEWILEPGDMLYVPPRFAHNGVAVGDDCMTYSIGLRAPSRYELLASWSEHVLGELEDEDRYGDPDLPRQVNPGEISACALSQLQTMIAEKVTDPDEFGRWFGEFTTTPKNPDVEWRPEEPLALEQLGALLAERNPLLRNPASRFSYIATAADTVTLFVDGQGYECEGEKACFARRLCAEDRVTVAPASMSAGPTLELILELYNRGSVAFDG